MKTRRQRKVFALLFALLGFSMAWAVEPPPPRAPFDEDDEQQFQAARNRQVMRNNCLICHSEEMIVNQRLTPAQWKAEVEKMVGWGAPLAKEEEPPLTAFLAEQYSPATPPARLSRTTYLKALNQVSPEEPAEPLATGDPTSGAKLYADNCANCHGPNARGAELGPNLVEKPVLFRPTEYRAVLRLGRRRMPGFQAALKPEQETALLAWLRQQR